MTPNANQGENAVEFNDDRARLRPAQGRRRSPPPDDDAKGLAAETQRCERESGAANEKANMQAEAIALHPPTIARLPAPCVAKTSDGGNFAIPYAGSGREAIGSR